MRILILINGAQQHRAFYAKVGAELAAAGIHVEFAVDSHYTDYLHPDVALPQAHYFSDYFKAHFGRVDLPRELADANVWTMFFPDVDRMMYTRFLRRRDPGYYPSLIANLGHFYADLFDDTAFDAIVYENVSNAFIYFAYEVAVRRGARLVGLTQSRMPGRSDVLDSKFASDSRLERTFHAITRGEISIPAEVRGFVADYLANLAERKPDYVVKPHPFHMGLAARYLRRAPIERLLRSWHYGLRARADLHYAFQIPDPLPTFPEQFLRESMRHAKARLLRRTLYQRDVDLTVPYFAYPLQFHPESSSSVDGAAFNDEWNNIEQTARNLPFGVLLYVKDHKHAAGIPSLSFYERVARIPNVVLVTPDFSTSELLRHARAIVVSTSTMGFEALLFQKPVFVLGHPFYSFFPGCIRIASFDGAFDLFTTYPTQSIRREDVEAFLAAYYLCSEEGYLDVTQQYGDPAAIRWIARLVREKTQEHVSGRALARAALSTGVS